MIRTFTIEASALAKCPIRSMSPSHYRDDGTCKCYTLFLQEKLLVVDKRAKIFHLTDNGKTSLCGIITHAALIHVTYASRELDHGEWCKLCQEKNNANHE